MVVLVGLVLVSQSRRHRPCAGFVARRPVLLEALRSHKRLVMVALGVWIPDSRIYNYSSVFVHGLSNQQPNLTFHIIHI